MPRIHILPDRVANQIAAGEVVERPAAVVKELVENALDAGATRIEMEFRQGGKSYLRVEDNGHGLAPDEALLALERHATSKIREAVDLLAVRTFGFRGEALPSIASVSRFQLVSRAAGAAEGTEVLINGGKLLHQRAAGCPVGTRVEVAHLFNSVPARRKFLKTDTTESAHITRLARLYAIAHPEVAFTLLEDGRVVFRSPSCPSLRERVAEIWGRREASEMLDLLPVADPETGLHLDGLLGRPGIGRSTRDALVTFVNRRPVESRTLAYAVLEAYHTYVPKGRYPPAILLLEIDPAAVDVNVHPAKREVRFRDEARVRQFVLRTVLGRLRAFTGDGPLNQPELKAPAAPPPVALAPVRATVPPALIPPVSLPPAPRFEAAKAEPLAAKSAPVQVVASSAPVTATTIPTPAPAPASASPAARGPVRFDWRLVGRWRGHVHLFETPGGLVLFNARAAHERVWFEELRERFANAQTPSQQLLFPLAFELDPVPAAALGEQRAWLNRHGFALEEFGRNFFRLEALPDWLDPVHAEGFLRDVADLARERGSPAAVRVDDIARLAATRAVRLGDNPNEQEIRALAQRLLATRQPLTCPRGRPTFVELAATDLARRFGGDAEVF